MATEKGKTLKVDTEAKTVLVKTVISEGDGEKFPEWEKGKREIITHVLFDFSTMSQEDILQHAANDLRIAVRRAHLVPMGPEKCANTSETEPFVISAELAGTSGRTRTQKLEDKSAEQLEELIRKAQELLAAKMVS